MKRILASKTEQFLQFHITWTFRQFPPVQFFINTTSYECYWKENHWYAHPASV